MSRVAIVTDSAASIPDDLIRSLNIHWVPYYIHRGQEVLRDLVNVHCASFYDWLPTAATLPTTASPGPGDYVALYEGLVRKQGVTQIASVHMTSKGSGAYQAASIARSIIEERLNQVQISVIDTMNVSMCQGWMAIEAARAALEGRSLEEITELVQKMIPTTRMLQTADTLRYLYLGGRIGKARHLAGTLLNIKPLISMVDGEIVALGQARGRHRAYEMMADLVESVVGKKGKIKAAFTHAAARQEVEELQQLFESRFTFVESIISELSPALGVHTGPGTSGVCYFPSQ